MTADDDFTVDQAGLDTLSLVAEIERAGFQLRLDLGDDFLRETRLLPLVHCPSSMPLDIVLACTDLHREFLDRARLVEAGGLRVPMMSPEDLVVTKVLAGRPKDLEDVRGVLEATLEETRLLTRFERLLRRSSVGDAPPSPARRKPR